MMWQHRLRDAMARFLRNWWISTWLTLGIIAVIAGTGAEEVSVEPTVLALCVAMVLIAQPGSRVRIVTGVLGAVGALLAIAQGEFGVFDRDLWLSMGILVGGSATIALVIMGMWWYFQDD